ncbi:hypothetical protein QTP70_010795 [Hemibagrus guttatus]|uniref:Alkylated DNA repair protein AlkB homologue 8 N-terminal domain-containing protein n=1 Tax=Hemibagrus guttatus TaxID=175788 RepID=A0AAE0RID8_9TELE|nr:hypothetical protein QTP70_010795 [Hemibagrus guttatus]
MQKESTFHFLNTKDTQRLWQGIRAFTEYKAKPLRCDGDASPSVALNIFYTRFEAQNNMLAGKTIPNSQQPTDDTTVIGLIQDGDESAYRQDVEQMAACCSLNSLDLNMLKTVEMIVDFRRNTPALPTLIIMNSTVPTVESFRFLGTTISQEWDTHIDSIVKKAQQRLYFLRQLRKFNLPQELLTHFYSAVTESLLCTSTTVCVKERYSFVPVKYTTEERLKAQWVNQASETQGCELEEKERFWSELDEVMESIPTGERVVIGADFNGHVGEGNRGDEEVMGKFGVKERNLEGQMVVDYAKRMDMKREEHSVTYKSGAHR